MLFFADSCLCAHKVGELLQDWRRINVSLTRAKKKLVMIGSKTTMQADRMLNECLEIMQGKKWVLDLAPNAMVCCERCESEIEEKKPEKSLLGKTESCTC